MDDISIDVKLGKVESVCGSISFTLNINSKMEGRLNLYSSDPTDMRKAGVFTSLDANGFSELKKLIEKAEQTIEKLQNNNQMKSMAVSRF